MNKYGFLTAAICSVVIFSNVYAGTVTQSKVYATNDQVTSTNLNGNLQAIITTLNGGIDNDNIKTSSGYRLYEVLGTLPAAGTQGRTVFNTSSNTLNFDTGSAWISPVSTGATVATGDLLYWNGTAWIKLNIGTANQSLISNGTIPTWGNATTFVDRGDPAAADKGAGNLTQDGNWNDWNLTPIIGTSAKSALLGIKIANTTVYGTEYIQFRKNGNSNALNIGQLGCQYNGIVNSGDIIVPVDSNGTIEYLVGSTTGTINVTVKGWWL